MDSVFADAHVLVIQKNPLHRHLEDVLVREMSLRHHVHAATHADRPHTDTGSGPLEHAVRAQFDRFNVLS